MNTFLPSHVYIRYVSPPASLNLGYLALLFPATYPSRASSRIPLPFRQLQKDHLPAFLLSHPCEMALGTFQSRTSWRASIQAGTRSFYDIPPHNALKHSGHPKYPKVTIISI